MDKYTLRVDDCIFNISDKYSNHNFAWMGIAIPIKNGCGYACYEFIYVFDDSKIYTMATWDIKHSLSTPKFTKKGAKFIGNDNTGVAVYIFDDARKYIEAGNGEIPMLNGDAFQTYRDLVEINKAVVNKIQSVIDNNKTKFDEFMQEFRMDQILN